MTVSALAHPGKRPSIALRVTATERSRRWAATAALLLFLVLALLPLGVMHVPLGLEAALKGFDHIGALCVAALHVLLAPVHGGFHLIVGAGVAYAIFDRIRAWRKLSAALLPLDAKIVKPGDRIWTAAVGVGVSPSRIRVVSGLPNPAFTIGLVKPTIYVAAELADRLNAAELRAVLSHEGAHVARFDPLRLTMLRGLGAALFWIPAVARLAEDLGDDSEIIADDVAAARGEAVMLASALLTLAAWRTTWTALPPGAVGFFGSELLERRVRRLLGEDVRPVSHLTRRSIGVAGLSLAIAWMSGLLMAHPLPAMELAPTVSEAHCVHELESPLQHLFCRARTHSAECPHSSARNSQHNGH